MPRCAVSSFERNQAGLPGRKPKVSRRTFAGTAVRAAASLAAGGLCSLPRNPHSPALAAELTRRIATEIPAEHIQWLREQTHRILQQCRIRGQGGVWLYTPDAKRQYGALWTRDFAYMVRYAGEMIPAEDLRAGVEYLLQGQREDGCVPDRVTAAGEPIYSPGAPHAPLADHALDNAAFLVELAYLWVLRSRDWTWFRRVRPQLDRGLAFVHRSEQGLVYNPPQKPQCPYGFTDTVAKTGHLLFCSVLMYRAYVQMSWMCQRAGLASGPYCREARRIRRGLRRLWDQRHGMFRAADGHCRQIDVWGSALAVSSGLTTGKQAQQVARFLAANYNRIVQAGQVRHLPQPEHWERFLTPRPIPPGTYQNGAYWATPVPWVVPVLARQAPELAVQMLQEVLTDFRQGGICECVNGRYRKLPGYTASATNVWGVFRANRI